MNALLTLTLSLTATAGGDGTCSGSSSYAAAGQKNIVETAVAAGQFKTLAAALGAADLVEALQGDGPFTVFAPTDEAFAKLPEGTVADLLKPENKGTLQAILKYHVVAGEVPASAVINVTSADTLNGQRVAVDVTDAGVMINGAKVVKTDIRCSNGIIHVIDSVIMPSTKDILETAAAAGSFETLSAAIGAAGLAEALQGDGPFTVFAPTDEAFAKLPEGTVASLLEPENRSKLVEILKFHVVSGRVYADQAMTLSSAKTLAGKSFEIKKTDAGLMVGGAKVVAADIQATNGVIHVIDAVLLP